MPKSRKRKLKRKRLRLKTDSLPNMVFALNPNWRDKLDILTEEEIKLIKALEAIAEEQR